ncbi:MAG: SMI1/KNR4 family protein [Limisphaerales bacterium]
MKALLFNPPQGPVSGEVITALRRALGVSIPEEYFEFLRQTNGGTPSQLNNSFPVSGNRDIDPEIRFVTVDFFFQAIDEDYPSLELINVYDVFEGRIPLGMLPFARNPFGDLFLLGPSSGKNAGVYYWDHDTEGSAGPHNPTANIAKLTDTFQEFIDALAAEQSDETQEPQ